MFTLEEISDIDGEVGETKPMEEYLDTLHINMESKTPYSDVTQVRMKFFMNIFLKAWIWKFDEIALDLTWFTENDKIGQFTIN